MNTLNNIPRLGCKHCGLERVTCFIATINDRDGQPHVLPEAMPIERVEIGALFALVHPGLWCRRSSKAHAGSPVPWDSEAMHPWVVELHGVWPDRDAEGRRVAVAFAVPCPVDPRVPSPEADAAIFAVVARAALHEVQEGLKLDGKSLDPHEFGELGLAEVWKHYLTHFGAGGLHE